MAKKGPDEVRRVGPEQEGAGASEEEAMAAVSPSHVAARTYSNPLGRASVQRPTPVQLERASVVRLPCKVHCPTP